MRGCKPTVACEQEVVVVFERPEHEVVVVAGRVGRVAPVGHVADVVAEHVVVGPAAAVVSTLAFDPPAMPQHCDM